MEKIEFTQLSDLELSLLIHGKIMPDASGLCTCEVDRERTKELDTLMEKYTYGWYIAQESLIEQLESIHKFKMYIINKSILG